MTTRAIRTTDVATSCDVCGRTLLSGEHAEIYLDGDAWRSVCELCVPRAVHGGWIREGTTPSYDPEEQGSERPSSLLSPLLGRLWGLRKGWAWAAEPARNQPATYEPAAYEPAPNQPVPYEPTMYEPVPYEPAPRQPVPEPVDVRVWRQPPAPVPPPRRRAEPVPASGREPRHVRAVPMSAPRKIALALEQFNSSEHRRTIAGVSRSLGPPTVAVKPSASSPSVVVVVVSWELCWYRYEVDLGDESSLRLADQGYELDELRPEERTPNASADEKGALAT